MGEERTTSNGDRHSGPLTKQVVLAERVNGSERLRGGELNAAITRALVGIQTDYLGRGPKRAVTFHHDNVVVTLMHEVLTRAEQSLTRRNQTDAVSHVRHLFQETMEPEFRAAIERLTGRRVVAFISGNDLDPDIAAEVFVLDEPLRPPAACE
jgi:uncharacterized protein YbcI